MGGLEGLGAIQRMLESYKQVSKALCGKEIASLEEILAVVNKLKPALHRSSGRGMRL